MKRLFGDCGPRVRRWVATLAAAGLSLLIASAATACGSTSETLPPVLTGAGKGDPFWQPMALFLAGMPLPADGELAVLEQSPIYQAHVRAMDGFWARVRTKNIREIEPWRKQVLPGKKTNTVLYPLSGADFVNAHAFFPHARRYVLIALESPGKAPDPRQLGPRQLSVGLAAVRQVISSIASRNYLYSAYMRQYMRGVYPYSGTLPAILLFNARLGHTILGVDPVALDANGKVFVRADHPERPVAVQGMRVRFAVPGERGEREILYWNIMINNAAVHPATPSGKYLRSLKNVNAMMKAAIYLLHRADMNEVRAWLLDSADLVLQGDSGLPYRAFPRESWKVELYGNYVTGAYFGGGIPLYHQRDLAAAYVYERKPLYFHYGYGLLTRARTSNIQIARKIGTE